ncbi:hypothetical protein N0V87_000476 [Didymella glomerata]|uniref:F-box domain-containing protein n=1 Tax=Didymella glomerata TaxID=749621 RepID=A0A9W8X7Z2_9PLEO|nr:hypothetical protein N0V87_000476 [Didymella glomerata]
MVTTRSKTRRASTPLSSPPVRPTLGPSDSPEMEHADDLPSERADDAAANAQVDLQDELSDDNAFDSDDDSDGIHEDHCSRHTSDLAAKCIGKTYAGKKCRYRGRIVKEGFFPHEHGITSIPCHIMCLPTELRLMIFRYVLPDVIPAASYFDKGHMAIMMVNRQFYMEASAIVYGELKFEAVVQPTYIALFGRQWHRESVDRTYVELDKQLCQAGARRIRHLEVTIQFGDKHKKINGIGVASVSHEDYEVYQVRDTVRKLVQLMAPEPSSSESMALRQLDVKPEPGPRQRWESDEVIAAIFFVLEPLLALASIDDVTLQAPPRPFHYSWKYLATAAAVGGLQTNKEFLQLRKQWVESMQSSSSGTGVKQHPKVTKAGVGTPYGTIEKFARLIYSEDAAQAQGKAKSKHGWTSSSFQGIERVLHLARVAHENGDLATIFKIHHTIMARWKQAHDQQRRSLATVSAAVSDMFYGDFQNAAGHKSEDLFAFYETSPPSSSNEDTSFKDTWPELSIRDSKIKVLDVDATVKREGARVILRKNGKKEVLLKTPAVARMLRLRKRQIMLDS